jgi:hypothetical protein
MGLGCIPLAASKSTMGILWCKTIQTNNFTFCSALAFQNCPILKGG